MKILTALAVILGLVSPLTAQAADSYPAQPITLLVGFRAGGSADTMSRVLARHLRESLGEPIIVENRAGGGGALTASMLKRARPNGYTLGVFVVTTTTFAPLYQKRSMKPSDFAYVASIAETTPAIVAPANAPFNTFKGVVSYAKKHGGALTYASVIPLDKMVMGYLGKANGITFRPVPTKGGTGVIQSVLGGVTELGWSGGIYQQYAKQGQIKVIAVPTSHKESGAPKAPTLEELGYNIAVDNYFIVAAPKGTPKSIVKKLSGAIKSAMSRKDYYALVHNKLGMPPKYLNPDELTQFVNKQESMYKKIIANTK